MRSLRTLDVPGFRLSEVVWDPASVIPSRWYAWPALCLVIDGGYEVEWGRHRLRCGPASLMLYPPTQAAARTSDAGSRCLTVSIDPAVLLSASDALPDLERFNAVRRPPPHWLAFQLRTELELRDDLCPTSLTSTVVALLAELGDRPGLEARSVPPPWLARVQEQIQDEFHRHHTLESLAQAAGVHPVHVAREFRRRFGCTVGQYIRQRRVEFACHRLTASRDALAEIAVDAGFADQSHFTNTFRQLVGMTPGVFRARFGSHAGRSPAQRLIRFKTALPSGA